VRYRIATSDGDHGPSSSIRRIDDATKYASPRSSPAAYSSIRSPCPASVHSAFAWRSTFFEITAFAASRIVCVDR
jgi:hypothetical protein